MSLTVRDLSFWYTLAEPPTVYRCGFEIKAGEFVAIVGESGGGKTTLLRLCCGLMQQEQRAHLAGQHHIQGNVEYDGTEVEGPRRCFSYVPQHFREGLHPAKSARDNVLLSVWEDGHSAAEFALADALMELSGISDAANMDILSLSGGQQQRVAICRALIKKPSILFMDEPFANLDPTLRPGMGELLRRLRREYNLSLLFVTHDIEGAIALADRVLGIRSRYSTPEYLEWIPGGRERQKLRTEIEQWISG